MSNDKFPLPNPFDTTHGDSEACQLLDYIAYEKQKAAEAVKRWDKIEDVIFRALDSEYKRTEGQNNKNLDH